MKLFHFILFILPFSICAQDSVMLHYAQTITTAELQTHLKILASDEYEGRETGKKGQKMAADYLSKHFKENGLLGPMNDHKANPYFQDFDVVRRDWTRCTIETRGRILKVFQHFFPYQPFELEAKNKEIVFLGYGMETATYSDYEGKAVKDKIVVILDGTSPIIPTEEQLTAEQKLKTALKKEVAAVVFVFETEEGFQNQNSIFKSPMVQSSRFSVEKKEKSKQGVLFTSPKNAAVLLKLSKKNYTAMTQQLQTTGKYDKPLAKNKASIVSNITLGSIPTENVLGFVKGAEKSHEVLVISAHYDHIGTDRNKIYNGADDDGSGTVALLEIAQAFSKAAAEGHRPKRSILFTAFTGEEKGLLGSRFYSNHPVFPLENTVANLNMDMIGRIDRKHRNDQDYIYIIGSNMLSTDLHQVHDSTARTYFPDMKLDYTYNSANHPDRYYYRSDHYNFAKNDIPVIFYYSGTHADYHQPTDTVDKIQFDKIARTAKLVFCTAWEIANREERLVVDLKEE